MLRTVLTVSLLLLPAACSVYDGLEGPTSTEIQAAFEHSHIPAHWTLKSFHIIASENVGSKVEPLIKYRFMGRAALSTDTFQKVAEEDEVILLVPVARAGEMIEIHGIAEATFVAGQWHVEFTLETKRLDAFGMPRAAFGPKRTIVKDSDEETLYRAEQKRKLEEDLARREALLTSLLTKFGNGGVFAGQWRDRRWVLRFNSFDPRSRHLTGQLEEHDDSGPYPCGIAIKAIEATARRMTIDVSSKGDIRDWGCTRWYFDDMTLEPSGETTLVGKWLGTWVRLTAQK